MRTHHVHRPLPTCCLLRYRQHQQGITPQAIFSIPICGPQCVEIVVVITGQIPPTQNTVLLSCDRFLQHAALKAQMPRLKPIALLATEVLTEFFSLSLFLVFLTFSLLFLVFLTLSTTFLLVPVNAAHHFLQDGPKVLTGMPLTKSSPRTLTVLRRDLTPQFMPSAMNFIQQKHYQSFSHCCHTLLQIQRLHVQSRL